MRSRSRILLPSLALLGLAAWWFLGRNDADGPLDPAGVRKERADTQGQELEFDRPTLKGSVPAGPRPAKPRFTLTVRAPVLSPEERVGGYVRVRGVPKTATGTAPDATDHPFDDSGSASIDIEALVRRLELRAVWFMVDVADYQVVTGLVELPEDAAKRNEGLDVVRDVTLVRAVVLTGRVLDPESRPIAGTVVAADYPGGRTRDAERIWRMTTVQDAEGRFRLRVRPGSEAVVLAWAPGMAPVASSPVSHPTGAVVDVGTLVLTAEPKWEGRVRGAADVRGTTQVQAVRVGKLALSEIANVGWLDGRPALASVTATVADDESFALAPIVPGWWRVRLVMSGEIEFVTPDAYAVTDRIVHTRQGFLSLDAARARLTVRVTRAGEPVAGAKVVVTGTEAGSIPTGPEGACRIVVRPSTLYEVLAFVPGALSRPVTYTSPSAGQEATLDLVLETSKKGIADAWAWAGDATPDPGVMLEVLGLDEKPVPAHVRVTDAGGNVVHTDWVERGLIARWRTTDRLLGRTYAKLLTPLPAGLYTLHISLDGYRPVEQPLQVGGTRERSLSVKLEPE